jgi:hypothetical protein
MLVVMRATINDIPSMPIADFVATAPLVVVSELLSTWALALVKTSIAIMLIRFQQTSSAWCRFLYTIIAVQITTATYLTVVHLTRCIALEALWNPTIPDKKCWNGDAFRASLTATSVLVIVTDVIYALMPLTFLRHMRRPIRDRIVIGVLLSLGLVATGASIAKTVVVQGFNNSHAPVDPVSGGLAIALWAAIEEQLALIAACIPCLKAPFHRVLLQFGVLPTKNETVGGDDHIGGVPKRQTYMVSAARSHLALSASAEEILRPEGAVERKYVQVLLTTEVLIEMSKRNSTVGLAPGR